MHKSLLKGLSGVFLMFLSGLLQAGTSCKNTLNNPKMWDMAVKKGLELKTALDRSGAKVAIIARVGSDVRKYGLYYTHAAFAVKDFNHGRWTVIHELNRCGTAISALHAEGLMNFFIEDLFNHDFEVITPTKALQAKLFNDIEKKKVKKLHEPHYNMLAYPFSTQYQNSNQWVLESIASAQSGRSSRQASQAFLQKTGYNPSIIQLVGFERLGANFRNNITFNDHPNSEQRKHHYSVVTVDSIVSWLKKNHWLESLREYRG